VAGEFEPISQEVLDREYPPVVAELGFAAERVLPDLASYPDWRGSASRRWLSCDHVTFHGTLDCARLSDSVQSYLGWLHRGRLFGSSHNDWAEQYGHWYGSFIDQRLDEYIDYFHRSLPFTAQERRWLISRVFGSSPYQSLNEEEAVRVVGLSETSLGDGESLATLKGGEVLDRWWAWRRGAFEFAEDGGVVGASRALSGIVSVAVPDEQPWHRPAEQYRRDSVAVRLRFERVRHEAGVRAAELRLHRRPAR